MIVGSAGHQAEAFFRKGGSKGAGIDSDLLLIIRKFRLHASFKATAFAAITCISGPPCIPGKTALSIALAHSSRHNTKPPRGPRRVLCVVVVTKSGVGNRGRMLACGDKARDMGHVYHKHRPDLIGDLAHYLPINDARVHGRAA